MGWMEREGRGWDVLISKAKPTAWKGHARIESTRTRHINVMPGNAKRPDINLSSVSSPPSHSLVFDVY